MVDTEPGINDPKVPNIVWAPSPSDRDQLLRLFVNPETIRIMTDDRRNAGVGQYAGLVHGNIQCVGVDNVPRWVNTGGLRAANACFRGIKRKMIAPFRDKQVFVYVINPEYDYVFPGRFSDLGPNQVQRPLNSVFTVFVSLHPDDIAAAEGAMGKFLLGGERIDGLVQNWNWTFCDKDDADLPDDWRNRYDERMWQT